MKKQQQSFKILSLNMDRARQRDEILELLEIEKFDVICFQEILKPDFLFIKKKLQMNGVFVTRVHWKSVLMDGIARPVTEGLAIFSRYPIVGHERVRYAHTSFLRAPYLHHHDISPAQYLEGGKSAHDTDTLKQKIPRPLLRVDIAVNGIRHSILTTHFTWVGNGKIDPGTGQFQFYETPLGIKQAREDMEGLLDYLNTLDQFVFTGDLNIARGGELYSKLAEQYHDHIPEKYISSMDPELFRLGQIPLMIDALMSTRHYDTKDTRLITGVSDHCGVVSNVVYPPA